MKRFCALLSAILVFSSVVSAAPQLPDYHKEDKMTAMFNCDNGAVIFREFYDPKERWDVFEFRFDSGEILVFSSFSYFIQTAGSSDMQKVGREYFQDELRKKSFAAFTILHGGGQDCKRVR